MEEAHKQTLQAHWGMLHNDFPLMSHATCIYPSG